MADPAQAYLNKIPLPTEKEYRHAPLPVPDSFRLPKINKFIENIQLDDILLIGLIILLLTEDESDNLLLILVAFILLAGFDIFKTE